MFGLSFWEIGLILIVALLVFGPSKLPELARSLGKGLREFRKATEEFKSTVSEETYRDAARPPPAAIPEPREAVTLTPEPAATPAAQSETESQAEPDAAAAPQPQPHQAAQEESSEESKPEPNGVG